MSTENETSSIDEDDKLIWGAKGMAPIANTTVRKMYHMIASGYLGDAVTQVGKQHVSTRRRLRTKLLGPEEKS